MGNIHTRIPFVLAALLHLLPWGPVRAQDPVNCYRFERTITRGEGAYYGGMCLFKDTSYYCYFQPDSNMASEVTVVDKLGGVQFERRIERAVPDAGFAYQPKQMLRNSDSTVVLLNNYTWTVGGINSLFSVQITCLNDQGDVVWHHEYRDPNLMLQAQRMVLDDATGDILISGLTYTYIPQNLFLLRLNAAGELLWAKRYTGGVYQLMSMVADDAHALYLGYHNEAHDFEVLKLSTDGIPLWNKGYATPYITTNYSAAYSPWTRSVAFSCLHNHTSSLVYDTINPLVINVDTSGTVIFAKHYRSSYHKSAVSIVATPDSGWVLSLASNHPAYVNGGLMKVDATGDPVWGQMYGTGAQCYYWSDALSLTPDGGTAHACDHWYNPVRHSLLIKSDRDGHTSCPGEGTLTFTTHALPFVGLHSDVALLDAPWDLITAQPAMVSVPVSLPDDLMCSDTVVYTDEVPLPVEETPASGGIVVRQVPGEALRITLQHAGTAMLFGPDGRLIRSFALRAGDSSVPLTGLAQGVCLLRVEDGSHARVWRGLP